MCDLTKERALADVKPARWHDSGFIRSISEAARVEVGDAVMLCGRVSLQKSLEFEIDRHSPEGSRQATGELTFVISQVEEWMACSSTPALVEDLNLPPQDLQQNNGVRTRDMKGSDKPSCGARRR